MTQAEFRSIQLIEISASAKGVIKISHFDTAMDRKHEMRGAIKFCFKCGLSQAETLRSVRRVFPNASLATVHRWWRKFETDPNLSVRDKARPGRPKKRTSEKVEEIRALLEENAKRTVRNIAPKVNLSISSTHRILKKDLNLSKKVAKLLPHELTGRQKERRLTLAHNMLHRIRSDPSTLERLVCGDETWVSVRHPSSRIRGAAWMTKGRRSRPSEVRRERATPKVLLILFHDSKGVVFREFLDTTLGSQRYLKTLASLRESIRRRRPDLWELTQEGKRNFWLLHDNAPAHRARIVQEKLEKTKIRLWAHPPHSPDLATCDFFVFPFLKQRLNEIVHESLADMKQTADAILNTITPDQWAQSLQNYRKRLQRVVEYHGRYFEGLDP